MSVEKLGDKMKVVLRGKFRTMNAHLRKTKQAQINSLKLQVNVQEK